MNTSGGMLVTFFIVLSTLLVGSTSFANDYSNDKFTFNNNNLLVPINYKPKGGLEIPAIYSHYAMELAKEGNYTAAGEAANQFGKTNYFESLVLLLNRTHLELLNADPNKGFLNTEYTFFSVMIENLTQILVTHNQDHKDQIEKSESVKLALDFQKSELMDGIDVLMGAFVNDHGTKDRYFQTTMTDFNALKALVSAVKAPLRRAPEDSVMLVEKNTELLRAAYQIEDVLEARGMLDSLFYRELSREAAAERMAVFERRLNSAIIEQPKPIEVLMNWERNKYMHPKREVPEVLALLGLPGTGKDTIAEAYVQSMHYSDKRAIEKHMYRVQVLRTQADQWSELGSGTGYIGSNEFPPLLEFVVNHSGGRYLKAGKEGAYKILENPKWKGVDLPGKIGPQDAVVYLNEFHDWSYMNKNEFAKEFLEKGILTVNNPNGGLKKVVFPTNLIIASNDGIDLIADRHIDGRPRGKRKSYAELMDGYRAIVNDIPLLRSAFMKTQKGFDNSQDRKGTSEEVVNRMPNIVFLAPTSPEGLRKIAGIQLEAMKDSFMNLNKNIGKIEISWSDNVAKFIQEYMYEAEDGARLLKGKIETLIQATIQERIMTGEIVDKGEVAKVSVDVATKADGTSELILEVTRNDKRKKMILPIKSTKEVAYKKPISQKEIDQILSLEDKINAEVFGVQPIAKKITSSILNARIRANQNEKASDYKGSKAQVFGFFGLSSTGKTEFTKVLARELTGGKDNVWNVDANQLQNGDKWQEFFGFDQSNPGDRSEFQKEYDRRQGKLLVVIDEIANVRDRELLTILYPYFDEANVGGRSMKNVTFILTGNAGEEWYQGIPKSIPEEIRHFSMLEIYRKAIKKKGENEALLLKYFREALLKRIGMDRVHFFSPLDHENIRNLSKLKINQLFKSVFSPNKETHWWDVYFKSTVQAEKFLTLVEKEGFGLDGQGRSIQLFVDENIAQALNKYLILNKIPIGSPVELSIDDKSIKANLNSSLDVKGEHSKGIHLFVKTQTTEGRVFVRGKAFESNPKKSDLGKIFTGYHEAGHDITTKVYLGDVRKSDGVTIQPGVTDINGKWIYYAGLAKSELISRIEMNESAVLREMAVLFGGEVAETLTSNRYRHSEGKSNDIERATELARASILEWGLSEKFGRHSKQPDQSYADYIATLSDSKKHVYEKELDRMLEKARALAVEAILINWETFIDLGKSLVEEGTLSGQQVEDIYERHGDNLLTEWGDNRKKYLKKATLIAEERFRRTKKGKLKYLSKAEHAEYVTKAKEVSAKQKHIRKSRDAEILHKSLLPTKVANIEEHLQEIIDESRKLVSAKGMRTNPVVKTNKRVSCKKSF